MLPEDVIYLDETGIEQEQLRRYGRSRRGKRVCGESSGGRVGRTTLIAGLYLGKLVAPLRFIGHTTSQVVIKWIRRVLAPVIKQGMTIILDNATFHNNSTVIKAFTDIGLNVLFLPPYSPDLNPIENYWAVLKKRLQSLNTKTKNFNKNLDYVIRSMS